METTEADGRWFASGGDFASGVSSGDAAYSSLYSHLCMLRVQLMQDLSNETGSIDGQIDPQSFVDGSLIVDLASALLHLPSPSVMTDSDSDHFTHLQQPLSVKDDSLAPTHKYARESSGVKDESRVPPAHRML